MQYNNVILRVIDPANITTVSELLQHQANVSLTEPGCERFEVYQSQTDPQTFLLVEWWASEQDLETHRTNKNFVEVYKPKVLPLVERLPHPSNRLI
jgi:quinol monooxygenase YgiN